MKQGLATSTRYTSKELINLEIEVKELDQKILDSENILFNQFKNKILMEKSRIENLSKFIGSIDFFYTCANNAIQFQHQKPIFITNETNELSIINGKHPVLNIKKDIFIPNDLFLNKDHSICLITGPNMGGKSTFLKQNALLILMSQVGMFVPAKMTTKVFDGLFVRIGAADDISNNESTFMVEMKECSEILNLSTSESFVVLDEVGRGTSVQDGISISRAIIEYLHDIIRCFCLISTHYNELVECEKYLSRFKNYKVDILIETNSIVFLYKIIQGIAEKSFGIEVAKKANLPKQVIERSKVIFEELEILKKS